MPKWTEKALDNTLADDHQIMRLDLNEVLPEDQNKRATLAALKSYLDIGFTQTKYVDPQATYTSPDGSIARPYNSLQSAIAAITDATPSKRYLVIVMAGSIAESVTLKNCVSVKGADRTSVKITGDLTLSTDIQYCSISHLDIVGNLTINNTGTNAASLQLSHLNISGTLDITGRGAGSDSIIINQCKATTAFNIKGLEAYLYGTIINGNVAIDNNGTVANTQGYLTDINLYTTVLLGNVDIESTVATEKVYVAGFGGVLSPGTLTLTCNTTDVYTVFDSGNYPRGTITIASGNPTIEKWDEAQYIKAAPVDCLIGTTVQEQLNELASLVCPLPSPSIEPIPSPSPSPSPSPEASPSPSPEASPSPSPEASPSPSPVASPSPSPSPEASPSPSLTPGGVFDPANTIFVGLPGSIGVDANTIEQGLALAALLSPTFDNPVAVIVYAGEYTEGELVVPDYVTLTTAGGLGSVVIVADDVENVMITLGSDTEINGFLIQGANNTFGSPLPSDIHIPSPLDYSTGILIKHEANALIRSCIITDCEFGIVVKDTTGVIIKDVIFNSSPVRPITEGIIVKDGTIGIMQACAFIGTPISKFEHAVFVQDSNWTMASNSVQFAVHGLHAAGNTSVLPSTTLFNYCDVGLELDGTTSCLADACTITNCSTDISILNSNVIGHFVGTAELNHVDLGGADGFFLSIMDSTQGDEGIKIVGELSVGTKERPSESVFGEGDSSIVGMHILTNTNLEAGTWNDITDELSSPSGSRANLFAATGSGNALYIGVDDYQFAGIKIESILSAFSSNGGLDTEYWTGTWTDLNVMETDANAPYNQRADNILRTNTTTQIRFNIRPGWIKKTLNGINAYWFRIVIVISPSTGNPSAERIKYHTNRTEVNKDGVVEYFGNARIQRQIPLSFLFDLSGYTSTDTNVDYNNDLNLFLVNNVRGKNARDGAGSIVRLPEGLDTSLPITFNLYWAPDTAGAGNVEHELYIGRLAPGTLLNGANLGQVNRKIQAVAVATQDTVYEQAFDFNIPDAIPTEALIWSYVRDSSGGNPDDTLGGAIYLVNMILTGYFWR